MDINYEYYKYFYYTAKYKSLSAAAAKMNSNQPNVSRIIKILETDLGFALFIRTHSGMKLTPKGENLYKHIKNAVEIILDAENELVMEEDGWSKDVRLAVSGSAMHYLLPKVERYKSLNPDTKLHISCHLTKEAVETVEKGKGDFAFVVADEIDNDAVKITKIMKLRSVLTAGPAYKELTGRRLSLSELSQYPMVALDERTSTYDFYSDIFERHGLRYKADITAGTTDQLILCIMYNLGIGFIPDISLRECMKTAELYPLEVIEELPLRNLFLIENKNGFLSPTANKLKEFLLQ